MAEIRNKRKLNSKQANKISVLISAVYFIFMLARWIQLSPTGEESIDYLLLVCGVGTLMVYVLLFFIVFGGEKLVEEEEKKRIENEILINLSFEEFKQVYLIEEENGESINILSKIFHNEDCKFYAKLTQDNNINLIVKDKHNDEVYSEEIKDKEYFYSMFQF
jgi:hypothetical protein